MSEQEPIYKSFDEQAYEGAAGGEAAPTPPVTLTMDDLHDREVNVAEAQAVMRRALPPNGTYETNEELGPLTFIGRVVTDQRTGVTRTMYNFSGRMLGRQLKNPDTGEIKDYTAFVRFSMSPDVRNKVDWITKEEHEGVDDINTRLWAQTVASYTAFFNEVPKTHPILLQYVVDHPLRYRLIQKQDASGMMVVSIQVKRAPR